MSNLLQEMLAQRDWLLLDGATGTNLFAMGLMSGEPPELWNVDSPDKVRALYNGFIGAGSDLILTNSFGGSSYRLKLHEAHDRVHELNRAAAVLARECVDAVDRPVVVAGSVGPTGEIMAPAGSLGHADAVAAFRQQIGGLMDGGADVIWAETISSEEEFRAVAEAADLEGAPFCGTLSFDTAGRTMMGVTSTQFAGIAQNVRTPPIGFGANCGTGASDLVRTVLGLTEAAPDALVIAKANAGIPKYVDGKIEYDGTPDLMARYACLVRDSGARLIGGCCGTKPEHLVAMRAALENTQKGNRPSLEKIEADLGAFTSASDGTGENAAPAGRTRGRRARRRG